MDIARKQTLNKMLQLRGNGRCKLIYSIRFCGKTHLLRTFISHLLTEGISKSQILTYELGAWHHAHLSDGARLLADLESHIPVGQTCYVILDDFHLIRQPEIVFQALAAKKGMEVYLTTSNAAWLSSEHLQLFSGVDFIPLYPISFHEYQSFCQEPCSAIWNSYVSYGGLPFILTKRTPAEKEQYLQSLIETYYVPDITDRHHIRKQEQFYETLCTLAAHAGKPVSYLQLAQNKAVSSATLKKYVQNLENAFLIRKAKHYDIAGKRYFGSQATFYFTDHGICHACMQAGTEGEDLLLKTIVYNELIQRGFSVDTGVLEYYTKDGHQTTIRNRSYVDFIARRGEESFLIQLAVSEKDGDEKSRTLARIRHTGPKLILQKEGAAPQTNSRGIISMGIQDFLLSNPEAPETHMNSREPRTS